MGSHPKVEGLYNLTAKNDAKNTRPGIQTLLTTINIFVRQLLIWWRKDILRNKNDNIAIHIRKQKRWAHTTGPPMSGFTNGKWARKLPLASPWLGCYSITFNLKTFLYTCLKVPLYILLGGDSLNIWQHVWSEVLCSIKRPPDVPASPPFLPLTPKEKQNISSYNH